MFCVVCASNNKTKLVRIVLVYGKDRPLQYNCTKLWTNKALLWSTINRHHTIQINSIRLAHKLVEYAKAKITKSSNGMIRKQNLLHCGQLKTNKRNAALLFHFIFAFRSDTKSCFVSFNFHNGATAVYRRLVQSSTTMATILLKYIFSV